MTINHKLNVKNPAKSEARRRRQMSKIQTKKIFFFRFLILICIFYFLFLVFDFASAAVPQEIRRAIDEKSQELQKINTQIREVQSNLEETREEGRTLKKEITKIDNQISQIKLGIRSSEVLVEKLTLEAESLKYDIYDIETKIQHQKKALAETLRELQQRSDESPLMIILKNKTLASSFSEIQNLSALNDNLSAEVSQLQATQEELNRKLNEVSSKKQTKEFEKDNLKNKKTIVEEAKEERQKLLTQTKNQEKIYQKTLSELEKRQAEIAAEIEKFESELRLKIDPNALPAARPGVLAVPISAVRITQGYGATPFALGGGYRGRWHNGVDYGAPIGTPIYAAEKGRVIKVGDQDRYCYRGSYGKYIIIKHENNLTTMYAHLSLSAIKEGAEVERGQLIGYVGRTGYATGPHLHFTVWSSATFVFKESRSCGPMPVGGDLNPLNYL